MTESTSPTISGSSGARRLVKEDDFGVHRQCAGKGDALLLSAGKLARLGVDIRVHADFLEILHRVFDALFAGAVEHLHLSGDAVIQHIHIAEQVELLKDHADFGVVARHVDRAGEVSRRGKGFVPRQAFPAG